MRVLKLPGFWLTKKIKKLMYSSHAEELVKSRDLRNVVENCQLWLLRDTVKWKGSGYWSIIGPQIFGWWYLVSVLRNKRKIIPPFLFTEKNVTVEFCVLRVKTY